MTARYRRYLSESFLEELKPGGRLNFLVRMATDFGDDPYCLDMHLRKGDITECCGRDS